MNEISIKRFEVEDCCRDNGLTSTFFTLLMTDLCAETLAWIRSKIDAEGNSLREYAIRPISVLPKSCVAKKTDTTINELTVHCK
jgi:hypothetical protein